MKNISMIIVDKKLHITIDLSDDKVNDKLTNLIGTTDGYVSIPGNEKIHVNVNCIRQVKSGG
jgi:hypothetical protein